MLAGILAGLAAGALWGLVFVSPRMVGGFSPVDLTAGRFVAYGMLRGWDAGYAIPSLGIYVAREARGRGVARAMMERLHALARERGAAAVRLKVYPSNEPARRLYESLGYRFGAKEGEQLVGLLRLDETDAPR